MLSKVGDSNDKLRLRGPDGGNLFHAPNAALGHRRLSIIDTSDHASQPMTDPSGRYTIVYNGEIFNFKELKEKFLGNQAEWQSHSDTEVLLHLFISMGHDCLPLLNGFFAFGVYDAQEDLLFLARDRFGKKPLHYYQHEDYLAFASEMKALLVYDLPHKLDHTALLEYLQLSYIPQPRSILQGVEKLMPGHYMYVSQGQVKKASYYKLNWQRPADKPSLSYADACTRLEQLMDESVKKRLIADVPLGAFLSGGIDSSVVVALASRHTDKLNTFSIGYKDNPFFDETAYALLVAKKYNTDHTVFSLGNDDFLQHIHDVLKYIDEPFADASSIPVYILSQHTRKHVTVALSGDGGDEVFAGYNKHKAEWRARQNGVLKALIRAGAPVWKMMPRSRNNKIGNLFRQLSRFAEGTSLGARERYWRWASLMQEEEAVSLLTPAAKEQVDWQAYKAQQDSLLSRLDNDGSRLEDMLATDIDLVLLSDMLVKVDLMSMANGLEIRSPFLDHEVVDFAFTLPTSYKINGKMKKRIVQDAFRKLLPPELYNRPKKGFDVPLQGWFRNELSGFIFDNLLSPSFIREQGLFSYPAIAAVKEQLYSSSPGDSVEVLWTLIVFQSWYKNYYQ